MAEVYLLESGTDRYLLEDSSGVLLLDYRQLVEQSAGSGSSPIQGGSAGSGETAQRQAQSFLFSTTTTLNFCEIIVTNAGSPTDDLVIDIAATLGGTVLATCTVLSANIILNNWTRFVLDVPVVCEAATTYYLQVSRSGARDAVNYRHLHINGGGSVYADGSRWIRDNNVWAEPAASDVKFQLYGNETGVLVTSLVAWIT